MKFYATPTHLASLALDEARIARRQEDTTTTCKQHSIEKCVTPIVLKVKVQPCALEYLEQLIGVLFPTQSWTLHGHLPGHLLRLIGS